MRLGRSSNVNGPMGPGPTHAVDGAPPPPAPSRRGTTGGGRGPAALGRSCSRDRGRRWHWGGGRLAAIGVIAAVATAACGGGGSAGGSTASGDRVLHVSFLQDPGQPPDPDIFYAGQGLLLTMNTYEGLLQYQPGTATPRIVGLLATSWTVSPDKKVYTFQLRRGVMFHDGTPFTAAAVKASFDRRLAVNQGPAYMVADVASVTTQGDYSVTITLKESNSAFLDYLASPYGPRMMSPTALRDHAGNDSAQTYLRTHDIGTGPYTLVDAKVGSHYALKAFPGYWGPKPYFTYVDIPVVTDLSTQRLMLDRGQIAIILHDLNSSAVQAYRQSRSVVTYSLPTLESVFVYVNPHHSWLSSQDARQRLLEGVDVRTIFDQVFKGRATIADQAYPAHMMPPGMAMQRIPYRPDGLKSLVAGLPGDQRTLVIGYDSSQPDGQQAANLLGAQLDAAGLTTKVQSYTTSEIYGWVSDPSGAPDVLFAGTSWPDAAHPYTWGHIVWDPDGGLNFLHCSDPAITALLTQGLRTGDLAPFSQAGELAARTGCWDNLVNMDDFMVAQPWLKGVKEAHVVTAPTSLNLAALSAG